MNGIITRRDVYTGAGGATYLSMILDGTINEIDDSTITKIRIPDMFTNCSLLSTVILRNCNMIDTYSNASNSNYDYSTFVASPGIFSSCPNLKSVYLMSLSETIRAFQRVSQVNSSYFNSPFPSLVETVYLSGELTQYIGHKSGNYFYEPFYGLSHLMSVYLMFSSIPSVQLYGNYLNPAIWAYTPMKYSSYTGSFGSIYVPASMLNDYLTITGENRNLWRQGISSERFVGV